MKIEAVRKLTPFERLHYWIVEREAIRVKKEAGKPKPWTDDEVLQSFRFCNVRRMDDKVSRWLYDNWYKPYYDHPNMLIACCIARFFNLPSSLEAATPFIFNNPKGKVYSWKEIKEGVCIVMRTMKEEGATIYNGAYMVRGNDGVDKVSSVMDHYTQSVVDNVVGRLQTDKMEAAWSQLKECYGWGSFMAGQVIADMRWAAKGSWSDRNDWAAIGPGSQRGMNRIMGREIKATIKQDLFEVELRRLMDRLRKGLPKEISSRLEAIDYQNCLCEQDKYSRVINQEGNRPKQKYPGAK